MSENDSFGQLASAVSDPAALIALEKREGKAELFGGIDALVANIAIRALNGVETVKVEQGRRADSISLAGLDGSLQAFLYDSLAVARQHSRGAWFLPEKVSLKTGWINLPSTFALYPRFATNLVWEERARLLLADSPAAVFIWSVLESLFEQLFIPFDLRGRAVGLKSREDYQTAWASVEELVSALGMGAGTELAVMEYGGGWGRLRAAEQLKVKQRFLAVLATQVNEEVAPHYRAYRLIPLITRYYSKAKNGQARRKQVLTRPFQKTLAGFFGGDWLGLLNYLGEMPHPDEEIISATPQTKLFIGSRKTPTEVAVELGLPAQEVQRALSTYWDTAGGQGRLGATSPVDERVGVLRGFWQHFDEIHCRQAVGMRALWGLVEEGRNIRIGWEGPDWYTPQLYTELLPKKLLEEIERLWASIMLPRWPDRIVSEISPHALMAEAFGPALQFWQGSALTAWFVCEGPMSRTDMAGLATYYQEALEELARLGCPIDSALFNELRQAENQLGPPEPLEDEKSSLEVIPGIRLVTSESIGSRRSGFERLRDIITSYRRAWAERYLDVYLRGRWESELREAARHHAQAIAEKGKPPTPKQFAKHAAASTNHWFGGDQSAFYAAIGEKSTVHPMRVSLMPVDRLGFARVVFEGLGGRPFERKVLVSNREEATAQAGEQDRYYRIGWLAEKSVRVVQLQEALGRMPEIKEFGASEFEDRSTVIDSDLQQAWKTYVAVVEAARNEACSRA